jgi:steroid delta-isomerase-like uncharacterized protein
MLPELGSEEESTQREGGQSMSEESKAIVQHAIEAWNTGNRDLFDEIWSADYVHHDPAEPDVRSLEDYKRYVAYVHSRYPGLHFAVDDMLAEGDRVATRYTWRITDTVGKEDRPPTGRQVTVTGTAIYHLAGGRIAEMWINWDELGYYRQLGVVPPAGEGE